MENIFYEKFPDYSINDGEDNVFLRHGLKVNRFKTMAENGFPGYEVKVKKKI